MLLAILLFAILACALLVALLLRRSAAPDLSEFTTRIDAISIELHRVETAFRDESARSATALREDLGGRLDRGLQAQLDRATEARKEASTQFDAVRSSVSESLREARADAKQQFTDFAISTRTALTDATANHTNQLNVFAQRLDALTKTTADQLTSLRTAIETRLRESSESSDLRLAHLRTELTEQATGTRSEAKQQFSEFATGTRAALAEATAGQTTQLTAFAQRLDSVAATINEQLLALRTATEARLRESADSADTRLTRLRSELTEQAATARTEAKQQFVEFAANSRTALEASRNSQAQQLSDFSTRLDTLARQLAEAGERLRLALDAKLIELATQNAAKLDEMRATVDQRLQATLEQRLDASFKLVGDNLERVIRSLGEMQAIATSVGDLKRVLTNVKTRGTWGEVQLSALLAQILTPDQYQANVAVVHGSTARVEFAIRLPGGAQTDAPVWLPIDAKFPNEDYQRLVDAADRADPEAVKVALAALAQTVRLFSKTIAEKYISPPHTTDFALLFLPTEGLYAEIVRQPGLVDDIQTKHRVVVVGPTTLAALLNSLQMGFRTLAIQQRSSEVWTVLAAVKTEFAKFGEVLANVKKKLDSASTEIDKTGTRTRAIERKLRDVAVLPANEAAQLLPDVPAEESDETAAVQ